MQRQIALKKMKPGIWYRVVTNGQTLFEGDRVKRLPEDDSLLCREAHGWLEKRYWWRLRNKVKVDIDYYKDQKRQAEAKIRAIDSLVVEEIF